VIGLPALVRRDFTKAFAPHLDGGFTVRPSWAYGLSLLVCLVSCAMAAILGRRAAHIDRCVAFEREVGRKFRIVLSCITMFHPNQTTTDQQHHRRRGRRRRAQIK
jgi:hypothetical protein